MKYAYDQAGRLKSVADWNAGLTEYGYTRGGRLASAILPNGVTSSYAYNPLGQLVSLAHSDPYQNIYASFVYSYDAAGNRTQAVEQVQAPKEDETLPTSDEGPQSQTFTIDYSYDGLYRLKQAAYSAPLDFFSFQYTYDPVGNRLTMTTPGDGTLTYQYDNANRLVNANGLPYTWDANGNLLADGLNSYEYDDANRLKAVNRAGFLAKFGYNGLGDRLEQTVSGVTTEYTLDIEAGLTQVLDDGEHAYLYGNGRIAQYSTATQEYFLGDALGSVRQLVDDGGEVILAKSYQPYGDILDSAGSGASMYGFTGEQTDNSGLIFLRARYYSSGQGRFISRDTWGGDYNRPLSLNRWNFVEANPINYIDPSGMCIDEDGDGLCESEPIRSPRPLLPPDIEEMRDDCKYGDRPEVKEPVRGWPLQDWEVKLLKLTMVAESRSITFPDPASQMITWIYLNRITIGGRFGQANWQGPSQGLERGLWQAVKGNQSALSCLYQKSKQCDPPESFLLSRFDKDGRTTFESLQEWIEYVTETWKNGRKADYLTYADRVVDPVIRYWQSYGTGSEYDPTNGSIQFAISKQSMEWNLDRLENRNDFNWVLYEFPYIQYGKPITKVLRMGTHSCIVDGTC